MSIWVFFLVFNYQDGWLGAGGVYFDPDALGEETALMGVGEGRLQGEEGTVIAVVVDPAADDVDLIYLGFTDDTGRVSQCRCHIQELEDGLLHLLRLVWDALLLYEAAMAHQKEFVVIFAGGGIDDKEVVGFDCPGD